MTRKAGVPIATCLLTFLLTGACTGDNGKAADEGNPSRQAPATELSVDAASELASINPAIPLYPGARYHQGLTRRDQAMIRNQYGDGAEVYTLASDDSFPQVYHYYMTYLAQFRGFPAQDTYPSKQENWRSLEVQLNQAMQDPFIPGEALDPFGQQVTLQVAETEVVPKTVIRYIVTPRPARTAPLATAAGPMAPQPVAQ